MCSFVRKGIASHFRSWQALFGRADQYRRGSVTDPDRVKTPMRAVDTPLLKKRILQFGVASFSIVASFHLRRNQHLISCSVCEFSHGLDPKLTLSEPLLDHLVGAQ
jgi:hypothetical protein